MLNFRNLKSSTKIAILVQGLFETSDSIGYDAVFQYKLLKENIKSCEIRLFAERYDNSIYPDVKIYGKKDFFKFCEKFDVKIIYHFCDGWQSMDEYLLAYPGDLIVRWHNNTPPWFYVFGNMKSAKRSIQGFQSISEFFKKSNTNIWGNSEFTARQVEVLGGESDRCYTVYPRSRFFDDWNNKKTDISMPDTKVSDEIRLLFVSRLVSHKGHKHIIDCARILQKTTGLRVIVDFPGRRDESATEFNTHLLEKANLSGVKVNFYGEVSEEFLRTLYKNTDVFICLSEHEGFGLPVFEAFKFNIPVVAWRTTALHELLADHPLALEPYDIRGFVAAIITALRIDLREKLLVLQQILLQNCSLDVLKNQMVHAVSNNRSLHKKEVNNELNRLKSIIQEQFDTEYLALTDIVKKENLGNEIRDYCLNYVTQYDLRSYQELFTRLDNTRFVSGSENMKGFLTVLKPSEFSYHNVRFTEDNAALIDLNDFDDKHIIFGPYISLPQGWYQLELNLIFDIKKPPKAFICVEVANGSDNLLLHKRYELGALLSSKEKMIVNFKLAREEKLVEIRVHKDRKINCVMQFHGGELKCINFDSIETT